MHCIGTAAEPKAAENMLLLKNIHEFRLSDTDILLINYVQEKTKEIHANINNPDELQKINDELSKMLTSVRSPEVAIVKQAIQSGGLNPLGTQAIKKALYETPLDKRGAVCSSKTTNPVQIAITQELKATENLVLLKKIHAFRLSDTDTLLIKYVQEKTKEIDANINNSDELQKINDELSRVLASVSSPEIVAVKQATQSMRDITLKRKLLMSRKLYINSHLKNGEQLFQVGRLTQYKERSLQTTFIAKET